MANRLLTGWNSTAKKALSVLPDWIIILYFILTALRKSTTRFLNKIELI
jgi:adenine specific DNA methylase Mod